MSELKKCPFCGGEAAYTQILGNYERPHEVYCSTCDGGITEGRSKDGVIHNWNTRPIEDALNARIAELVRDKKALRGIEENLREHIDIGTLQLSVATARIAELKDFIDQLIKLGDAVTSALCVYDAEKDTREVCDWDLFTYAWKTRASKKQPATEREHMEADYGIR